MAQTCVGLTEATTAALVDRMVDLAEQGGYLRLGEPATRPFRIDIVQHLSDLDGRATPCGSVNTVTLEDGRLRSSATERVGVAMPQEDRVGQR
jgi:shikimate 5-dehydrogenase